MKPEKNVKKTRKKAESMKMIWSMNIKCHESIIGMSRARQVKVMRKIISLSNVMMVFITMNLKLE